MFSDKVKSMLSHTYKKLHNHSHTLEWLFVACELSVRRNVLPKLQEMCHKESNVHDMVCVKTVRSDKRWRVNQGWRRQRHWPVAELLCELQSFRMFTNSESSCRSQMFKGFRVGLSFQFQAVQGQEWPQVGKGFQKKWKPNILMNM